MKFAEYNHAEVEPQILDYWTKNKVVDKLRKLNAKGPKFYFLDGPPYTSGKFHLAHAWNYALKDIVLRYKRMQRFHLWDRNGFDVHGLPTEHKVMDKHGLKTKDDIQKFGVAKFVKECEQFCLEMAEIMKLDLQRMGVTLDLSNPYMALRPEFIEGEWTLIKKAHEQKRLYFGEKVLTWCQHCETAVAKHECEYKPVHDTSIFVKFPLKKGNNEFLIIWTTTPWTIPFNLAVMVNPELEYVKVDVDSERWILAKALAGMVVQSVANKKIKVLEEFTGTALEGLEYTHPFAAIIPYYAELKKKHPNVHSVILNEEYVDTSAGTGLVHAAPGCGPEDQQACKPYNIPPFNPLGEDGLFPVSLGKFAGLRAKVDDKKFIAALEQQKALIATTTVEHEYPHCWRCKNPVIFRITNQWFFKVEDLKEKILDGNKKVHWIPTTANHAYESWTTNLKDNAISRQRFWGTPIPIWRCTVCNSIKVIGSRKELQKAGGKIPKNLHVPWIDDVELRCPCKGTMQRVPDVIDVWVDAGTASWNCLDNDPKKMKQWFPADFISEAKEQTRLWFSMLSICSYLYLGENSFKNVYVYGMLYDIAGQKMSKSLGNIISPYEFIDKHGVDVLRYYMCQNNAGVDINFSWDECTTKQRNLLILWNIHKLLINLSQEHGINPAKLPVKTMEKAMAMEEQYIISRLHSTIKNVTSLLEQYRIDQAIAPLEALYLDLSRTYIQMVRDKSAVGDETEKEVCVYTIYTILLNLLKMFNIIAPFISEAIYLNLKEEFGLKEISISHYGWPAADARKINADIENSIALADEITQAALAAREKAKLGLRWPVREIVVASTAENVQNLGEEFLEIIKKLANTKTVRMVEAMPGIRIMVKPNYQKIGPAYGALSPQIIAKLSIDSAETIIGHLEKEGVYEFTIDGKKISITKEMVVIEREAPAGFVLAESKKGVIYLNTVRTPELEAEGYAREVMRNIQQVRKNNRFEKVDEIVLFLKTNPEMKKALEPFKRDIAEKVGAKKIELSYIEPVRKFQHTGEFMVKKEKFIIWFEKVK